MITETTIETIYYAPLVQAAFSFYNKHTSSTSYALSKTNIKKRIAYSPRAAGEFGGERFGAGRGRLTPRHSVFIIKVNYRLKINDSYAKTKKSIYTKTLY